MTKVGDHLEGKYHLLRLIGEGGMGAVYEAEHEAIERKVAVKLLRPEMGEDDETVERFKREARAAARIGHPNIVGVTDFGAADDGSPFIVMDLLEGQSLREALASRAPLVVPDVALYACQILSGLHAAHRAGIVHRDLKPDNVFLVRTWRDIPEVRLLDFGISKIAAPRGEKATTLTKTGTALGTPSYMSPEQAWGDRAVDHRTDIWSVGVLIYECLTGQLPFRATHVFSLVRKITDEPVTPPREIIRNLPEGLESLVLKALAKDPNDRYQEAATMYEALLPFVDEQARPHLVAPRREAEERSHEPRGQADSIATAPTIDATPSPTASTVPPRPERRGSILPIAVAVLVALICTGGVVFWLWRGATPPAPPPAREPVVVAEEPDGGPAGEVVPITTDEPDQPPAQAEMNLTKTHRRAAAASSVLTPESTGARYGAERAFDGLPGTAWGATRGEAAGQWLEVTFDRPVAITSIDVRTGHCRDDRVFAKNRRVKRARLSVGSWQTEQAFADERSWQTVRLSSPVEGTALKLTVLDVYEGDTWPDLHVAEIRVWGHPVER